MRITPWFHSTVHGLHVRPPGKPGLSQFIIKARRGTLYNIWCIVVYAWRGGGGRLAAALLGRGKARMAAVPTLAVGVLASAEAEVQDAPTFWRECLLQGGDDGGGGGPGTRDQYRLASSQPWRRALRGRGRNVSSHLSAHRRRVGSRPRVSCLRARRASR